MHRYSDPLYATTAIRSLHGREVRGRAIRLDDATSLSKRRKEKKVAEAFAAREGRRQARAAAEAAAQLQAEARALKRRARAEAEACDGAAPAAEP